MSSFINKVALITGASSQIGIATALSLAKHKCMLSLTSRSEHALKELSQGCILAGLRPKMLLTLPADLTQENTPDKVIKSTLRNFGKLNILINCEEKFSLGSAAETSLNVFDEVMNTNVRIAFQMIQLALPHLISTKGNIVNVSSIASLRSFPGLTVYGMSKSALDHLTHTAAIELVSHHVRVNSVNPSLYLMSSRETEPAGRKEMEEKSAGVMLGRWGDVKEVVAAIEFLASDAASFVTGVSLPVDGGRSTFCPQQYSEH